MSSVNDDKKTPIKKKYKTQGMLIFWIAAWVDFVIMYLGVTGNNSVLTTLSFVAMVIIAGIAYYFA